MQTNTHAAILIRASQAKLNKVIDLRTRFVRLNPQFNLTNFALNSLILNFLGFMLLTHELELQLSV